MAKKGKGRKDASGKKDEVRKGPVPETMEGPKLKAPSKVAAERSGMKKVELRRPTRRAEVVKPTTEVMFGPLNWLIMAGGVAFAAIGFVFLYFGDVVWSTTFLVLGYCVAIPVGLLLNLKKKPQQKKPEIPPAPPKEPKPETPPETGAGQ